MQITGYVQEQEGEIENHLKEPAQLWKKIIWIVQTQEFLCHGAPILQHRPAQCIFLSLSILLLLLSLSLYLPVCSSVFVYFQRWGCLLVPLTHCQIVSPFLVEFLGQLFLIRSVSFMSFVLISGLTLCSPQPRSPVVFQGNDGKLRLTFLPSYSVMWPSGPPLPPHCTFWSGSINKLLNFYLGIVLEL